MYCPYKRRLCARCHVCDFSFSPAFAHYLSFAHQVQIVCHTKLDDFSKNCKLILGHYPLEGVRN